MERSVHAELTTGAATHRFFIDGGVFGPIGTIRLDDIGTVLSDISGRRYTIHPDDPLSAKATMEQTSQLSRDDWAVKVWTYAEQTATETDFHRTHPNFAGHGYAGVRMDMRGTGDSEGVCLGEYLLQEQEDALAVIAWLAA